MWNKTHNVWHAMRREALWTHGMGTLHGTLLINKARSFPMAQSRLTWYLQRGAGTRTNSCKNIERICIDIFLNELYLITFYTMNKFYWWNRFCLRNLPYKCWAQFQTDVEVKIGLQTCYCMFLTHVNSGLQQHVNPFIYIQPSGLGVKTFQSSLQASRDRVPG